MTTKDTRSVVFLLTIAVWLHPCSLVAGPASDIKVWPIFYRASDPVTSGTRTEALWPLYVRQSTSQYTANQILSFPQRYPTQYPNQFYVLWPLSGVRTGHGHGAWLFPFLWSGAEAGGRERHHALFPAFYYGHCGDGRTLNVALLQHNRWGDTSRLHALWPFLWLGTSRSGSDASYGLLPLFWFSRDKTDKPGRQSESSSGGVLLLNWWHRGEHKSTDKDGSTRRNTDASDGVFPVFYRSNSSHASISPEGTLTSSGDRCWIFPYWQSHDTSSTTKPGTAPKTTAKSRHVLFPFWWDWSRQKGNITDSGRLFFPLWWHSAKSRKGELIGSASFLVPVGAHLYRKGQYETQNLLGPVLNRTENKLKKYVRYDAFFPILSMTNGRDRSGGRVFPLGGWEGQRSKYSNLWYLFPLGWRCESQEGGEYRVDSPRFWALHEMESRPFANNADCSWAGPRRTVAFYPFFWSKRQADTQSSGFFPFWCSETRRSGHRVFTGTWLPLLLGHHGTYTRDGKRTYACQDYLFSILAWGKGENYKLRRVFPVFSYRKSYGRRNISSLLLPFSYETSCDREKPELRNSSRLSIPFHFLPWYGSRSSQNGAGSVTRRSWFFPFYKRSVERSPERDVKKLSILWPLWNAEWENEETRIRGFGGMVNFYEKDANGFVEQRILYRLFTRRTRSWLSEYEIMPFYARQSREDGNSCWKLLGGLLGSETRGGRSYFRLLYIPIPTGKAHRPGAVALAKRQREHADLALDYLRHGRHDRAAVEFTLAGTARADDRQFQLATAEAYLRAEPEAISKELRSSVPSSLESLGGKSGYCDTQAVRKNLRHLAIRHFEDAIRLGADRPMTLRKVAWAYSDIGRYGTGLEKLAESDRLRPSFATGMERLTILACLQAKRSPRRHASQGQGPPDKNRMEPYRGRWKELLTELQNRYPNSPTLILREAAMVEETEGQGAYTSVFTHLSKSEAFSPITMRKLALYERGAQMRPGPEERAWLAEKPSPWTRTIHDRLDSLTPWSPAQSKRVCPCRTCAVHAITILSRRASLLMDDKKHVEAEALFPRIRKLLPRVCEACAGPDRVDDPFGCISAAMRSLYRLHVDVRNKPLTYIERAKEWAVTLCSHHRKAIERSLKAVRFEQQYLKRWRIIPVAGCNFEAKTHRGKFFDRYVNLDAILGQPDNCTVAAECVLVSPDERRAVLRLGFDHTLKVELNGETVFREHSRRIAVRDEFTVPVRLKKGENRLKLTIADNTLGYGFFARLSGENGDLMEDVSD